ncbi:MAG: glycosyltransferase, partial [Actinobacteria bacterium]|nr:glycosyltransferase [Actinomycetota bacterium]
MCDRQPRVSVVIPVFNGARWLTRQLDALRRDGAQPFETVIADNGSTDDSVAIVRSFGSEMSITAVDASARRGQAYARNVGATVAAGEYLLFLDQDDEIGPGYVEAMVTALRSSELAAARMDGVKLNEGWRSRGRILPQTGGLPGDPVPWAYGCTLGVRRSTFERLGGFAEDLGELGAFAAEDIDFCWRAHENGVA